MLVLTRRKEESIIIGSGADAIRVKVLMTKPSKVSIGIDAPLSVPVYREEIYLVIEEENRLVAQKTKSLKERIVSLLKKS